MQLIKIKTKKGYTVRLKTATTIYQAQAKKLKTAIKKAFKLIK